MQIRRNVGVKAENIHTVLNNLMVYESTPWLLLNFRMRCQRQAQNLLLCACITLHGHADD